MRRNFGLNLSKRLSIGQVLSCASDALFSRSCECQKSMITDKCRENKRESKVLSTGLTNAIPLADHLYCLFCNKNDIERRPDAGAVSQVTHHHGTSRQPPTWRDTPPKPQASANRNLMRATNKDHRAKNRQQVVARTNLVWMAPRGHTCAANQTCGCLPRLQNMFGPRLS